MLKSSHNTVEGVHCIDGRLLKFAVTRFTFFLSQSKETLFDRKYKFHPVLEVIEVLLEHVPPLCQRVKLFGRSPQLPRRERLGSFSFLIIRQLGKLLAGT